MSKAAAEMPIGLLHLSRAQVQTAKVVEDGHELYVIGLQGVLQDAKRPLLQHPRCLGVSRYITDHRQAVQAHSDGWIVRVLRISRARRSIWAAPALRSARSVPRLFRVGTTFLEGREVSGFGAVGHQREPQRDQREHGHGSD